MEGAEFPYKPAATDTFHVIEGEAELETHDGKRIEIVAGGIYSFPAGFTATWRTRTPFMKFFVVA
ncbi:cupin domain-containing protein [Streptomyces goshikiensis]|uniref:cupin domain-containing protein n=1 Tax=Streptomyces goshikiensis TaxID=1942 RepID=UPI0036473C67